MSYNEENNKTDTLKVNWNISHICNFSCDYCVNKNPTTLNFNLKEIHVRRVFKILLDLNFKKYTFVLTGGEPTLHPLLIDTIKIIYMIFGDKLEAVNIISNGSRGVEFFKNFTQFDKRFSIRLSIHPSNFSDDMYDLISFILDNNIHLLLSVLFDIRYYPLLDKICEFVSKKKKEHDAIFEPAMRCIYGEYNRFFFNHTQEDKDYYWTHNTAWGVSDYLIDFSKLFFNGKFCVFGTNFIIINPDLSFTGGYCFNAKRIKIPIIFLNKQKLIEKLITIQKCNISWCPTLSNLAIPKFDTIEDAELFTKEYKKKMDY